MKKKQVKKVVAPKKAATPKPPPNPIHLMEARMVKRFQDQIETQIERVLKSNRWYWEHVLQKGSEKMSPKIKAAIVALLTALVEDDAPAAATPAPKAEKPTPAPKPAAAPPKDALLAKAREVVGAYGKKNGKEATRAKLDEFTKGTVADVPADKLQAVIDAFSVTEAPKGDDLLG